MVPLHGGMSRISWPVVYRVFAKQGLATGPCQWSLPISAAPLTSPSPRRILHFVLYNALTRDTLNSF
jgi:hypothetical protein